MLSLKHETCVCVSRFRMQNPNKKCIYLYIYEERVGERDKEQMHALCLE